MPSSVIRAFHYHPATAALDIIFVSGRVYRYQNVPAALYQQMCSASSKGTFFNDHIRDHFAFARIDEPA